MDLEAYKLFSWNFYSLSIVNSIATIQYFLSLDNDNFIML